MYGASIATESHPFEEVLGGEEQVFVVGGRWYLGECLSPLVVLLLVDGLRGLQVFVVGSGDDLGLGEAGVMDLYLELFPLFALFINH